MVKGLVERFQLAGSSNAVLRKAAALLLLQAATTVLAGNAPDASGIEFFEKHVRPVLVEHCYKCHSAEAEKLKGGLSLDTRDGLLKGGDSGPAIVPGTPEKSLLIKAVRYADENLQMPPAKGGGKLPDEKIEDLVAWVKMGAPDPRTGSTSTVQPQPQPNRTGRFNR
jgi:mono/diheme cytochrome c family protein